MSRVPDGVSKPESVPDVRADTSADRRTYGDSKPLTHGLADCFSDAIAQSFAATAKSKSDSAAFAESHALPASTGLHGSGSGKP